MVQEGQHGSRIRRKFSLNGLLGVVLEVQGVHRSKDALKEGDRHEALDAFRGIFYLAALRFHQTLFPLSKEVVYLCVDGGKARAARLARPKMDAFRLRQAEQ